MVEDIPLELDDGTTAYKICDLQRPEETKDLDFRHQFHQKVNLNYMWPRVFLVDTNDATIYHVACVEKPTAITAQWKEYMKGVKDANIITRSGMVKCIQSEGFIIHSE